MPRIRHLIHEIHRRSLWQVLAIYLGSSWLVFEAVQALTEGLHLPEWVPGVAFVLLLVGLPIVLGTAFVQEGLPLASPSADPAGSPEPRTEPVAPAVARVLTWRNAIIGGVLAFGVAGLIAAGLSVPRGAADDAVATPITSLAVLPFDNLTGDVAQAYFVDGMQDALIAELARIGSLKVISRTSTLRYRETDRSAPEISAELGAEGLIEGSVLRDGNRVRITVQLIHGSTDRHLWAESYEREMQGILALQAEVGRAIAGEVRAALGGMPDPTDAPTVDPAAYEAYLKGVQSWLRASPQDWRECVAHLERSTDLDPEYAPAFAYLSLCHALQGYYTAAPPSLLHSRARAAADRAVALDPELPEAQMALAIVHLLYGWDWEAAERGSARAVQLSPNSQFMLQGRGLVLSLLGRSEDAVAAGRRGLELDPLSPFAHSRLGWYYFLDRQYEPALRHAASALDLDPDYSDAYVISWWAYALLGDQERARQARAMSLPPWGAHRETTEPAPTSRAWLAGLAGDRARARAILDSFPPPPTISPHEAFWAAIAYGAAGDNDRAFELLDRTFYGRSAMTSTFKVDPRLDVLRGDARFDSLLARLRFPD